MKHVVLLSTLAVLVFSCSKDKESPDPTVNKPNDPGSECSVTQIQDSDGNKTSYYYDASGRLSRVVSNSGKPDSSFQDYSYNGNQVTVIGQDGTPQNIYYMNSYGYFDSMTYPNDPGSRFVCSMNSSGKPAYIEVQTTDPEFKQRWTYTWSGDNIAVELLEITNSGGDAAWQRTNTFGTEKNPVRKLKMSENFFPQSQNLETKFVSETSFGGSYSFQANYVKDSDGKVTKSIITNDKGDKFETSYFWRCK